MMLQSKPQRRSEKDVVGLNPHETFRIVDHNLGPRVGVAAVDSQPRRQEVSETELDIPGSIQSSCSNPIDESEQVHLFG